MKHAHRDAAERIDARRNDLVARIVQRHYERDPDLKERYGPQGRIRCTEDAEFHLSYLAEAIRAESDALFLDYVAWARELLESRGIPAADLEMNLAILEESLREVLPEAAAGIAAGYVTGARAALADVRAAETTPQLSDLGRQYLELLVAGNRAPAEQLLAAAVDRGMPLEEIYTTVFEPALHEVGRLWQRNKLTVAQEHLCTAATDRIMARLLARARIRPSNEGRAVVTSVASEQHSLGARMLADFLEMDGWDVHYLGSNTPATSTVEIVRERQASVLAISATMTYHIPNVRDLIIRVRARGDLSGVRVLVGGHPFNVDPNLWQRVGADGYAINATSAVAEARRLTAKE